MLREWEKLPKFMQCAEVRKYYEILAKKQRSLYIKRVCDLILAVILLVMLFLPMIIIATLIKLESKGDILYRQERITIYGKRFKIHKFRTMINGADKCGSSVTTSDDTRITKIGAVLRKYRLDELPQLFDILSGNMSFVGTRPEVVKYVKNYRKEYFATLLMPAGITSEASIRFKNEAELLQGVDDIDKIYIETVLPKKMRYNLESILKFSLFSDLCTMLRTVVAVFGKDY